MEISGLSVKQGGATVELLDDHLVDLFMLFADDFDLGLGVSGQKYLVKDNGVDQDEQNTVDDLLLVGEEHLEYQDRKVKYIEHHGHWKTEFLVQDQWRNIHTSGRGAGPDDDADGKPAHVRHALDHDGSAVSADAHKARVTQRELAADTDDQIQRDRQDDVDADVV